MPAMMRLFIRLMQGLKGIADYCDLQVEVIKERGETDFSRPDLFLYSTL